MSKAQRTFQQLVERIASARDELAAWQAFELRYNTRVAEEIEPQRVQMRTHRRKLASLMDDALTRSESVQHWGRALRTKLSRLLVELVGDLLDEDHDPALEALHDRHSDVPHAEVRRLRLQMAQSMLNDVYGIDVGEDHGAATTEELLDHARQEMERRAAADAQREEDARAFDRDSSTPGAAQMRREQRAKEVSQSLREIYRKLASALHPDREQDSDARQRKTALMQRVNQAYDANDLLTLLSLQLEIEQIDADHLASVPPQRLAHYNKVLREQLADLEAEVERHVAPFRHSVGLGAGAPLNEATVEHHLNASVAQLRRANRELREDVTALRDPDVLRQWVKHARVEEDAGGSHPADEFLEPFEEVAAERREKKPKRRR